MSPPTAAADLTFDYAPGVHIRYRVRGTGQTPLVFLHGFAAALETWDDLAPLLPPELFTLYLLDLKGFGRSSKPRRGSYAIEEQAAVVTAFIRVAGLHRVVLVGHSLGGGIALLMALTAKDRGDRELIARLVLIDCAAYPQRLPRLMSQLRRPLLARLGMAIVPVRTIVRLTMKKVFHDRSAITPERVSRYERCFGRPGMAGVLIRSVRDLDLQHYGRIAARYGEIDLPTLVIWGEKDRIVKLQQGERLHAEIAGSRLAVIAACGHNPHEERPRETCDALLVFLEGSTAGGATPGSAGRQ